LNSERRFLALENPLNDISRRKIGLYIGLQIFAVAATVTISQTIAAIGFPVLIIALIPLRTFLMPRWFTKHELSVLDALTANNKSVLASLGGHPTKMKELAEDSSDEAFGEMREAEGMERAESGNESDLHRQRSHSAVRQRMGNITRQTAHKLRSHSVEGDREEYNA
jgi:hypothetical protein